MENKNQSLNYNLKMSQK